MEVGWILGLYVCLLYTAVSAVDPYYIPRAKILTRDEVNRGNSEEKFRPSAIRCRKIGEKAAKRRISCIADTDFYDSLSNRVHKTRLTMHASPSRTDRTMKELANRISKCSIKYGKYFEKGCSFKSDYYAERRKCRQEKTARDRTLCKGALRRRFSRGK